MSDPRCKSCGIPAVKFVNDSGGVTWSCDTLNCPRFEGVVAVEAPPDDTPRTPRGAVLEEARKLTEGDRNKTHGDILTNHQAIVDAWNWWLWNRGLLPRDKALVPSDVSEMMSLLKKARKVSGHAAHHDHGVDDCAYSAIAQELREMGS